MSRLQAWLRSWRPSWPRRSTSLRAAPWLARRRPWRPCGPFCSGPRTSEFSRSSARTRSASCSRAHAGSGPPLLGVGRQDAPPGPRLPALLAYGSAGQVPRLVPFSTPLRGPSTQGLSSPYPLRGPGSGIPCAPGSSVPGASPEEARVRPLASRWEGAAAGPWRTPCKTTAAPMVRPGRPSSGAWCFRAGLKACSWRQISWRGRSPFSTNPQRPERRPYPSQRPA